MGIGGTSLISATGLAGQRGGRVLFRDLDIVLAPGDALVVTGPNGSGKTSLLRLLAGLCRPAAGTIERAGGLALLSHDNALKPALTVRWNLGFWAACQGGGNVQAALEAVGLAPAIDLPVRILSSGQQRRVAIARLLLAPVPLWLLDEPTVGLDAASITLVEALMAEHRASGGAVVAVTHSALSLPDCRQLALAS